MFKLRANTNLLAAIGFLGLAIAQAWPLPLYLGTRLTGSPSGDTGAYVWNTWVFAHELLTSHRVPLSTLMILPLDGLTDLSLHNYTLVADLLAVPLQPLFGVVASFNLIYLASVALAGWGTFLLARRVTGRVVESWIAGALFACSPFLVARSTAHFSLVAAAPLPFFLLAFEQTWRTRRVRDALLMGATVAWAAGSDPYYAVYCVMLGAGIAAGRIITLRPAGSPAANSRLLAAVASTAIAIWIGLVVGVHFVAGGTVRIGSVLVSMRTLYTPMLVLTALVAIRLWCVSRVRVGIRRVMPWFTMVRVAAIAAAAIVVLMGPQLYALALRAIQGEFVNAPVLWRSSAPGVDLLAFFLPNPNHPWAPQALVDWIAREPGGYAEQVASLSWVGLAIVLVASYRAQFRPGRLWLGITVGFGLLALGPFIRVAGVDTYIPTPWTLLRYVPGIAAARMPPRFAVVALLGFTVLVAQGLVALTRRYPQRRRLLLASAGFALAFELLPVPRTLYSAEIPAVYRMIAADPRPTRVLGLPFGVRDGLSSLGNFNPSSLFFQTAHGKQLVGGYLSRVPPSTKEFYCRIPTLNALMALSEGRPQTPQELEAARRSARSFIRRAHVGYVVMDRAQLTPGLREFAVEALGLIKIADEDGLELWVPQIGSGPY
jgi:hypothetical protein